MSGQTGALKPLPHLTSPLRKFSFHFLDHSQLEFVFFKKGGADRCRDLGSSTMQSFRQMFLFKTGRMLDFESSRKKIRPFAAVPPQNKWPRCNASLRKGHYSPSVGLRCKTGNSAPQRAVPHTQPETKRGEMRLKYPFSSPMLKPPIP